MKRLLSLILILSLLISLSTGLSITAFAAGETVTATVQGTYTKSEAAQDVTIRLQPTGLTGSYCMFAIAEGITLPEGFAVQSFSTSYTNQPITNGDYNTDNGQLTYLESGTEDNIPADTYYDMVITAPANAEGQYQIEINTVQIATEYCTNMVIEDVDITVPLSINAAEPVVTEYDIVIDSNIQNGIVTASHTKAAEDVLVTLTVTPATGFMLDTLTVMNGETPVEVTNNTFEMPAAAVTVSATFKTIPTGYTVTMGVDKTVDAGETIQIPVTVGYSAAENETAPTTYKSYEVTFQYDTDMLTLVTGSSDDEAQEFTVVDEDGTVIIRRYGNEKNVGEAAVTLEFTANKTGESDVKLTSAKIGTSDDAQDEDIPVAAIIDELTKITVSVYNVDLDEAFTGAGVADPETDYTFEAKDIP